MNRIAALEDKEKLLNKIIESYVVYDKRSREATGLHGSTLVNEEFRLDVIGVMEDAERYGFVRPVNKKNENKYDKTCESKNPDITSSQQTTAL